MSQPGAEGGRSGVLPTCDALGAMDRVVTGVRLVGWAVVAGLGLLAMLRVAAWETRFPPLLALNGLGAVPYLGAIPVAAFALARRQVRLGLVAGAVAVAVLPTGLPELAARADVPPGARTAPRLRVLSWNLYQSNTDAAAIDRVIRDADADIVLLQEVSKENDRAVQQLPALAAYGHRFVTPEPSAFGSGIWSRLPLEGGQEFDVGGLPMTRAVVLTPAGPLRLVNVHTLSPVTEKGATLWPRQLRLLGDEARRPGPPILLGGDFNATWGHRPFRRLLETGLDDAAAARGQVWSPTWPAGRRVLQPALRIDHVLTGPGLVATSYATGGAGGSDHRSIVAEVAILST